MNKYALYEKIPVNNSPVRIVEYDSFPEDFVLHWHEQTEILFVKEGVLKIRCGEKSIEGKTNDCIIINGNELHEGIGGDCKLVLLYFSTSIFNENHYMFNTLINDSVVTEIIEGLLCYKTLQSNSASLALTGLTYLLASHLVKNHTQEVLNEAKFKQYSRNSKRINDAIKYIEENYSENINTAFLAKLSYLSEGHFCNLFKSVTGKTATDYITSIRIDKAEDLIKTTDLSMIQIAMQCGFSDSNYFSRIFKRYKKISPTLLRKL